MSDNSYNSVNLNNKPNIIECDPPSEIVIQDSNLRTT